MLVASLGLVIASTTVVSLWVLRNRLQTQVLNEFSSDLLQSVDAFSASDADRLAALRHENALLADLPSLKALMTTADTKTVIDGGRRFWTVAGSDLFALADRDARILALYTRGDAPNEQLHTELEQVLGSPQKHFLLTKGRLFEFSVQPLFFGTEQTGTLLGYVVTGYAVDSAPTRRTTSISPAEITFLSRGVITSTIPRLLWPELTMRLNDPASQQQRPATIHLGQHSYLMSSTDLSDAASRPLFLIVMKSFAYAEQEQSELNRLLVGVGLCALCAGTVLMLAISGFLTAPLERLTRTVKDYGTHAVIPVLPSGGTREVRELSGAFLSMSEQLREKNQALLDAERLATIGRMASSVSHDLRHYLAAVYANAEFLVHPRRTEAERNALFEEIRTAVHGTTDLIDSLLIFSRSSSSARSPALLSQILDRAVALVKAHPDAQGVAICASLRTPSETEILVDARQVERAVYNLLLNACQAARGGVGSHSVTAHIETEAFMTKLHIADDGAGVADTIRDSLFEPFVSEGKQNGTGLGLTIANVVAREHGGSVRILRSRPGETIFVLSLALTGREHRHAATESWLESSR